MANLNTDLLSPEQAIEAVYQAHLSKSMLQTKTYYISNNGLDTNNGLTELTPFKTIAKALTLISDYTTLKFECGSIFYEPLVYQHSNLTFESYGIGSKPIIDGSSIINTPTLVSGNVWQTTNTYVSNKQGRVVIYQDGVPMQPVANQSECEALPNSYVALTGDSVNGGTYTTMFHTGDNNSPIANGKVYRTNTFNTIRPLDDLVNRNNIKIKGIEVRYGFNSTTLEVSNGYGNVLDGCNSRYGSKHNIYISADSVGKNLVAYGAELQGEYGRSATLFVAYHLDPGEGKSYKWEDCVAIQDLKKVGKDLGQHNVAFIDHCGAGHFIKATFNRCYIRGTAMVFSPNADIVEINNCYAEKISSRVLSNNRGVTTIKNTFLQRNFIGNTTNENGVVDYKNSTFINHVYANCETSKMTFNNCLFYGGNSLKYQSHMMASSSTGGALSLTMINTIIFGYQNFTHGVIGTDYSGDYNIFYRTSSNQIRAYYNGIQYQTLSSWQTATGQDANSVYLTDVQSKTFFLTDPSTGVVTINPYATVTASNGTVYTGTFPDGTLLTDKFTNKNYSHLRSKYVDELDLLQYQN